MHRRSPQPRRLDVPRTFAQLYPGSRSGARVRVVTAGTKPDSELLERLLEAVYAIVACVVAALVVLGIGVAAFGVDQLASILVAAGVSGMVAYIVLSHVATDRMVWSRHGRARGLEVVEACTVHGIDSLAYPVLRSRVTLRGLVGARQVPLHLHALTIGSEAYPAYVATVQLAPGVAEQMTGSSCRRRAFNRPTLLQRWTGRRLELESERLVRDCSVVVGRDDDELRWRELLDPALLDLLADGIDVEWHQDGERLVLATPVARRSLHHPDADRIDTLVVAAVALERRFALAASDGAPLAAAATDWKVAPAQRRRSGRARHLARERARDLDLQRADPELLFVELARYASDAEVARVREQVQAGTFRIDWLDDLVHHRRARFWGEDGDADEQGDAGSDAAADHDAA